MGGRPDRNSLAIAGILIAFLGHAQHGSTFAYTGEDAIRTQADLHFAHFGGLTNNLALYGEQVVFPYLPALFYEMGYLVRPANRKVNFGLHVTPEIFLNILFMGRVTGTADLLLFNEAETEPGPGLGIRLGIGYSALGSTFEFTEHTPIVRAGFLISNIRVTYAHSLGRDVIVDHQLGIGIKFDW